MHYVKERKENLT